MNKLIIGRISYLETKYLFLAKYRSDFQRKTQ